MEVFLTILGLIAGLALVVVGSDFLVDGASAVARKAGISEFVIGLTIVGFGTSCPELVVSLTGALKGISDIAIGNVIGSNVFNAMFILGLTAVILPVPITLANRRRDLPIGILVTVLFLALSSDGKISLADGIVMLVAFAAYMFYCFKFDSRNIQQEEADSILDRKLWLAVIFILAGLAGLVFGGRIFVDKAVTLARMAHLSDKFIAITILAGGTSLPELATSVVAAIKGKGQMALGNILGSNVFNLLLIIGAAALVSPLSSAGMNMMDMVVLLLAPVLLYLWSYTGKSDRIDRWEGAVLLCCFIAYYVYLFIN